MQILPNRPINKIIIFDRNASNIVTDNSISILSLRAVRRSKSQTKQPATSLPRLSSARETRATSGGNDR